MNAQMSIAALLSYLISMALFHDLADILACSISPSMQRTSTTRKRGASPLGDFETSKVAAS